MRCLKVSTVLTIVFEGAWRNLDRLGVREGFMTYDSRGGLISKWGGGGGGGVDLLERDSNFYRARRTLIVTLHAEKFIPLFRSH